MKFIFASALVGMAMADFATMSDDFATAMSGTDRDLTLTLGQSLDNIRDYGCWCFFDDAHGAGKGRAVDIVDAHCKNLHMAYDCAIIDVTEQTGTDDCVPWEEPYNSGIGGGLGAVVTTCQNQNTGLCAEFACMAEGVFVLNMLSAFFTAGAVNSSNLPSNGFDFRATCTIQAGTQTPERSCCGILPFRYPYKPLDRECCGASTFDPALQTCCSDDVPRFSCV